MQKWWSNSAEEKNLIGKIKSCRACEHPFHLKKIRKSYAWRCCNTKCRIWDYYQIVRWKYRIVTKHPPPHSKNGFLNEHVITSAWYNKCINTKKNYLKTKKWYPPPNRWNKNSNYFFLLKITIHWLDLFFFSLKRSVTLSIKKLSFSLFFFFFVFMRFCQQIGWLIFIVCLLKFCTGIFQFFPLSVRKRSGKVQLFCSNIDALVPKKFPTVMKLYI